MRLALLSNSALNRLILVNIVIAVVELIAHSAIREFAANGSAKWLQVEAWLGMPLKASDFLSHIYGLFFYMFFPHNVYTFFFTLMMLWSFGRIFAEFMGGRRLIPLFIYGGIAGSVITFISFQLFKSYWPSGAPQYLLGAVAPACCIVAAVTVLYPNLPLNLFLLGPVKLKFIAGINMLLLYAYLTSLNNPALSIAGAAGILFGVSYALLYRKGYDLTGGFIKVTDMFRSNKSGSYSKPHMKVTYRRPLTDDQYNTIRQEREATLDELLDKIHEKGIKSLSKKEKQLLEKYSKQ